MSHWMLDVIVEKRFLALREAGRVRFHRKNSLELTSINEDLLRETASSLEIAVLDLNNNSLAEEPEKMELSRKAAADAFRLLQALPVPKDQTENPIETGCHLLRASMLAVLGCVWEDAVQWLRALEDDCLWPALPLDSTDWGELCMATVIDVWLRVVRINNISGMALITKRVEALCRKQESYERDYLQTFETLEAKSKALNLIALYHIAKAACVLANYITDWVADGLDNTQDLLCIHFDRAVSACDEDCRFNPIPFVCKLLPCVFDKSLCYDNFSIGKINTGGDLYGTEKPTVQCQENQKRRQVD